MILTPAQVDAIASGEAVSVDVHGTLCVVIRKDVYEGRQRDVDEEDFPSSQTTANVISSIMAEDDANDPALDSYQQYKKAP
jgi:hypothetical protein